MDIIGPFIREHFQESELPTATDQAASIEADMIQFRADMAHRIQRGWWPIIIGPRGSGKSRAIAEAVKDKYAITEVKLARHTVQELFGQEDESGKWNLGIITRFLNPNSKACVINLITPISSAVAHNFASMFCSGCILAKIQPVDGAGFLLTPMMGSIPGLVCMRENQLVHPTCHKHNL